MRRLTPIPRIGRGNQPDFLMYDHQSAYRPDPVRLRYSPSPAQRLGLAACPVYPLQVAPYLPWFSVELVPIPPQM